MSIYSIFYNKLPSCKEDVLPSPEKGKIITFLNPFYLEKLKLHTNLYAQFDYICSDGILPIFLNRIWHLPKSTRLSFDMTSLAKDVFECHFPKRIYFIGSTQENIEKFVSLIKHTYPKINICGFHHGYIRCFNSVGKEILNCNPNIIVIGMGAPLQDEFAIHLKEIGYQGTIYTCGGFFHQTTKVINYYPNWINKLNLRALYRILKEPYVISRIIRFYPNFIIHYSTFLLNMKFKTPNNFNNKT